MRKKQEERENEIKNYQEGMAGGKGMSEEEEKNQRIRKGLAALNIDKKLGDDEIQQKRKNFMSEIRDALISGDGDAD